MTSKEALDKLVSKTSILDDTCANLKKCIKTKKCRFNEPCETCEDYNLVKTITQDLERLEALEQKEISMKPIDNYKEGVDDEVFKNDSYICPKCCNWLNIEQKYCDNCGQKLDWSECNE